jgi:hypothetical protein
MKKRVIVAIGLLIVLSGCLTVVPEGAPTQPITEPIKLSDDAAATYNVSEANDIHIVTPNAQTSKLYNISKERVIKELNSKGTNVSITKEKAFDAPSENGTLTVYLSTTTDTIPYVSNTVSENTDGLDEDTAVIQSAIDQRGEDILIIHGGEWGVREATDLLIDEESISLGESLQTRVAATFREYTGVYGQSNGEVKYEVIEGENNTEVVRYVSTETRQEIVLEDNVTVRARTSTALITPISARATSEYKSISVIEIKTGSMIDGVDNEEVENTTQPNASSENELNTSTTTINRTSGVNNASDGESQTNTNITESENTTNNSTTTKGLTNRSEVRNMDTSNSSEKTTNTSNMDGAEISNETSSNSTSGNETNINNTG